MNSSDEDYNSFEDRETNDELVESEELTDERIVESRYKFISNIFSDRRPDPHHLFTFLILNIQEKNPHLSKASFSQAGAAFQLFL